MFAKGLRGICRVRGTNRGLAPHATDNLDDLRIHGEPPSLRLHKLKGNLAGYYAIDIDKTSGWRITFKFKAGHFSEVSIQDYH